MKIQADTLYSSLSNEIRLRCLMLLQCEGELCVCELTHALALSQPMVSRHLALLRSDGLVQDRRAGQWIYYQINHGLESWAQEVLSITAAANKSRKPFKQDLSKLHSMADRPQALCCG